MGNSCTGASAVREMDDVINEPFGNVWLDAPHLKLGKELSVTDAYKFTRHILGEGRHGIVWVAVCRGSKEPVAVKQCSKSALAKSRASNSLSRISEIEILLKLQEEKECPYITRLIATYEDAESLYLVCEMCRGGDLYMHMASSSAFCEQNASEIAEQILLGLKHIHEHRIVHRDLKPENVRLATNWRDESQPVSIRLVDFASAAALPAEGLLTEGVYGMPFFTAPEAHKGGYAQEVDMWSFGVLVLLMVGAVHPAQARSSSVHGSTVWLALQNGQLEMLPDATSPSLEDFVLKLLTPDPGCRLTVGEALAHPWITGRSLLKRAPLEAAVANALQVVQARKHGLLSKKYFVQDEREGLVLEGGGAGEAPQSWKKAGQVTSSIKEFKKSNSKNKFYVEVLEYNTPSKRSRSNSKDYIEFPGA